MKKKVVKKSLEPFADFKDPKQMNAFSLTPEDTWYVYFLWFDEEIVYIGQTISLESRINQHKKDKLFNKITYETFERSSARDILRVEAAYIAKYRPVFNNKSENILKTPKFCFFRSSGSGEHFEAGIIYKSDNGIFVNYYDGEHLHTYVKSSSCYVYRKDNKDEQSGNFSSVNVKSVEFYVEEGKLKYNLTKKPPRKETVRKPLKVDQHASYFGQELNDSVVMEFGKHKSKTIAQILLEEPTYVVWMVKKQVWDGALSEEMINRINLAVNVFKRNNPYKGYYP